MRHPILAEVTHTALKDLESCYGLETRGDKTYAIIGYAYEEEEFEHW